MFKFKKGSKLVGEDLIGLDFGAQILKVVYIKDYKDNKELVDLFTYNIEGLDENEVAKILENYLEGFKLKKPHLISIISPQLVITKNIEIPSVDPQEIREIINLQASRHTPYSREEIIVDYIEIGVYKKNYTKILLIIVAKNSIKRQISILEKIGLSLDNIVFSPEGVGKYFRKILKMEDESSPYGIIHVDGKYTDFLVVLKNNVCFIRAIPIGAIHLLNEKDKYYMRFLEEIKISLEAYQNENIDVTPQSFVLTGAIEDLKNFSSILYNTLHLPVREVSYFRDLKLTEGIIKKLSTIKNISFLNILGSILSLGNLKVDLIPEEIKLKRSLEEQGKEMVKSGIYILSILVIIFIILVSKIWFKTAYLKALDLKFSQLEKEALELEKKFSNLSLIKKYLSNRGLSLEVLRELYELTTDNLEFTNIRFDDGERITITGTADTMSSVFSFVERMNESKYFKEAKTKYTTKRREGSRDLTDFEINALIDKKER